ncbi:MAG: hypothetical protein AABW67_05000 [Nanoarchaeota archaeon]
MPKKPNLQGIKYNLGNGNFTDSIKEFKVYLRKESKFYQGLSEISSSYALKRKSAISSDSSDLNGSLFA